MVGAHSSGVGGIVGASAADAVTGAVCGGGSGSNASGSDSGSGARSGCTSGRVAGGGAAGGGSGDCGDGGCGTGVRAGGVPRPYVSHSLLTGVDGVVIGAWRRQNGPSSSTAIFSSAVDASSADWGRSAGALASSHSTHAQSESGTPRARPLSGGTGVLTWL
jgi:hypothetical protein